MESSRDSTIRPCPNLFLVGTMKSGTTSLHTHLGAHPDVFMSAVKEPDYFISPRELRARGRERTCRDETKYLRLFAEAGGAAWIGESSNGYTKLPWYTGVPERLVSFSPRARVVCLLRDPIERTLSHFRHDLMRRRVGPNLLQALRSRPEYLEFSHYARQLAPYFRLFGTERIYTLTLETLQRDPVGTLQQLFAWLDVDSSFVPPRVEHRHNPGPPEFSPSEAVLRYMRPLQRQQTAALEKLLGRSFPEWTTLWGLSPRPRFPTLSEPSRGAAGSNAL